MKISKNNSGYSVIIILLIIGLLLFLGIGIFNLILNDLKDNKAMGDYYKAYAGAESASELALLQIKKNGYAYYDRIDHNLNNRSIVLSNNPLDVNAFKASTDIYISYDIGSKVDFYEGSLDPLGYDIVPLFYIDDTGEKKVTDIEFSLISGEETNLAWNVIGKEDGISGEGTDMNGYKKTFTLDGLKYSTDNINNFISNSDFNYMVLLNSGDKGIIKYKIKSKIASQFFSKPKTSIISSAQVGNYKQNLNVDLNNTEYLNMLKYSIYSE
ncbi:MAG: hypothetical protein Q8K30_00710 [Candidatus Gracilibacteria bacterium]|nr:hypothetical protein [Candidatus Gracilibacteria bacterium]